ncbi:YccS family putative transporter [Vibrio sp. HN007]|uniref:YccS family putative transporter n=1 Tax=Vibrio iocasae TaxID=3098914 RepID=UPI0035D456E9
MLTHFHRYWNHQAFHYGALILFALLGVIVPCWYFDSSDYMIPMILGVIAAALAESDDNFSGRLRAQTITVICFLVATLSIEILFAHPILFALGLFTSTIGFIMLGAIGPRYAKIAFGSLLIAIYTMLGAHQSTNYWLQPLLLITGAIWYFISSLIWLTLSPLKPVQQSLANVFVQISTYMDVKRELFHPVEKLTPQPLRIKEANLNAKTVQALNECKATFLSRSKRGHVDSTTDRFLNTYFIAQDIHERISSSHYRYQELASLFMRSDVLFRFKHVIELQSKACLDVSKAIGLGVAYEHSDKSSIALEELKQSIENLDNGGSREIQTAVLQIQYLFNNLSMVEKQLANISNPDAVEFQGDELLEDTEAHTFAAMWERVHSNLNPGSLLFRHALRLSIALVAGYTVIQQFNLENGYWILLTILFVCQPNYSATKQKLVSRVAGTVVGLLTGSLLLSLFPSQISQLVFIVLSGVAFFVFRVNNYSYATAFITVLVLFCFNQLGEGYAVILPRLADTLIGCVLSVLAVTFILPDWQSKRLHKVMAESVNANKLYLAQIIGQYRIGKQNDLQYRIARRNAHTHSANLSSAINNMLSEPGRYQSAKGESFRFLTLNHALLSYISAMGAHRSRINDEVTHQLILDAHRSIHQRLEMLSSQLNNDCENFQPIADAYELEARLNEWHSADERSAELVLQQLHLILRIMPELHKLANDFASCKA